MTLAWFTKFSWLYGSRVCLWIVAFALFRLQFPECDAHFQAALVGMGVIYSDFISLHMRIIEVVKSAKDKPHD
jgi:hypothetical protein